MAKTIAIVAEKGGVGKTTSVLTLGRALVELERRVLLVDLDPQASLTKYLGHDPRALDDLQKTVIYSLIDNVAMASMVIPGDFDVVPSFRTTGRKSPPSLTVLREALGPLQDRYDYILIDAPPVAEHLIIMSLAAADRALIPVEPNRMAVDGLGDLLETVASVREHYNPGLSILGILPTKVNRRHKNDAAYMSFLGTLEDGGITVFDGIPFSTQFKRAAARGRTVIDVFPQRLGSLKYYNIANHLIKHE